MVQGVVSALISLGQWPKDFGFTSFQYLRNARIYRHSDSNTSLSLIFSFGPFTGGALRTVDGELNIYRQATLFRGDKEHWVEDHQGLRHSIALYSHRRAAEISFEMAAQLASSGFILPPSISPSTECLSLRMDAIGNRAVVLIEVGFTASAREFMGSLISAHAF